MNTERLLQSAENILAPWRHHMARPESNRLDAGLATADLLPAVQALQQAGWGYLVAITGVDLGVAAGEIEVLYHFCEGAAIVTLRLRTPRDAAVVPSVCSVIPSASFFEREVIEMLGVTVEGTPNTDHLFLPDEWPKGVYPLRKDFQTQPNSD
jgi:NADH:ubiquinone oxidoreductase subunit C